MGGAAGGPQDAAAVHPGVKVDRSAQLDHRLWASPHQRCGALGLSAGLPREDQQRVLPATFTANNQHCAYQTSQRVLMRRVLMRPWVHDRGLLQCLVPRMRAPQFPGNGAFGTPTLCDAEAPEPVSQVPTYWPLCGGGCVYLVK